MFESRYNVETLSQKYENINKTSQPTQTSSWSIAKHHIAWLHVKSQSRKGALYMLLLKCMKWKKVSSISILIIFNIVGNNQILKV